VAVTAGVVGEVAMLAARAQGEVSAQAAGTAGEDVRRGPRLLPAQAEGGDVVAQDVGDGDGCALGAGHAT
jgi:hypothetical protein